MAKEVNTFVDTIPELIEVHKDIAYQVSSAIWSELMFTTPVDTGTLKANWGVSIGSRGDRSYYEYPSPRPPRGTRVHGDPAEPNWSGFARDWSIVSIWNNTPYLHYVNAGVHGNGANKNFVERAVDNAVSWG